MRKKYYKNIKNILLIKRKKTGAAYYFKKVDNIYQDEDGLGLTVKIKDNEFIMTDKEGNQMIFTKNNIPGYLSKIKDVAGSEINITYDTQMRIIKVVDANQSEINVTYETNKITVISPSETVYLYYTDNKLMKIVTKSGETVFSYNDKGLMSSITDEDNRKINMIITKDTSRLGRDYIGIGELIKKYFPNKNVRYIVIHDGIDTFIDNTNDDTADLWKRTAQ